MSSLKLVNHRSSAISALALVFFLTCASIVSATPFTINAGNSPAGTQTLDGGEKGVVESGGTIDDEPGVLITDDSDGNTLNNFGAIIYDDDNGHNVVISDGSDDNKVNNYGLLETDDGNGLRIDNDSSGNTFNNYGEIVSDGNDNDDFSQNISIRDNSDDNTINNYGEINIDDGESVKIQDGSDDNILNNYGSITSNDDGVVIEIVDGIGSFRNTINNYGEIVVDGDGVIVGNGNDDNIINNYGKIFADSDAIDTNSTTTLNLFSRSQIIGRILMDGDDGDVVNVNFAKAGTSSTLTFEPNDVDLPTINLKNDNMVRVGDRVLVVDPTGPSIQGAALGTLTDKIHGAITNHLLNGPPGNPQLASASVQPGMIRPGKGDQFWVSGFGSKRERDEDGRALAYNQNIAGGVAGYETSLGQFRVGGLGGYAHTDVVTDTQSNDTNTSSWFLGGYGQAGFGIIDLSFALLAGYEQNDNDRWLVDNLNGFEIAHGNFDSYFLSPSATVSSEFMVMDNIAVRPSATASYSVAWYNSYTETGTTLSNLSIDSRSADAFIAKFQIGTAYIFSKGNEFTFRIGGRYRYTDDDDIEANLAGTSFQYAAVGDDENLEGYFGGNLRLAVKDWVSLNADMEYSLNDIENSLSGVLGLEFTF